MEPRTFAEAGRAVGGYILKRIDDHFIQGVPPDKLEKALAKRFGPFIDRPPVASFFALIVVLNTLFIGVDLQLRATTDAPAAKWGVLSLDALFAAVFTVEICLRFHADRCPKYWKKPWNLLDLFLVATGTFDILMQLLGGSGGGGLQAARAFKATRMIRLLRILRLFKLKKILRMLRSLILITTAVTQVAQPLLYTLVMFFANVYVWAIVTTEYIGMAGAEDDEFIATSFGHMSESMKTLIRLSTLDDWGATVRYVSESHGAHWSFLLIFYILIANLVFMNMVIGLLVERIFSLSAIFREAKRNRGNSDEVESWMKTPSSLVSTPEAADVDQEEEIDYEQVITTLRERLPPQTVPRNISEQLQVNELSALWDAVTKLKEKDSKDPAAAAAQAKVFTRKHLQEAQSNAETWAKFEAAVPAFAGCCKEEFYAQFWTCPHQSLMGMNRTEFLEACMIMVHSLGEQHFLSIADRLRTMEVKFYGEFVHLNEHQRSLERRFVKLRHRIRKMYSFQGGQEVVLRMIMKMKELHYESQPRVRSKSSSKNRNVKDELDASSHSFSSLGSSRGNDGGGGNRRSPHGSPRTR